MQSASGLAGKESPGVRRAGGKPRRPLTPRLTSGSRLLGDGVNGTLHTWPFARSTVRGSPGLHGRAAGKEGLTEQPLECSFLDPSPSEGGLGRQRPVFILLNVALFMTRRQVKHVYKVCGWQKAEGDRGDRRSNRP